MTSTAWSAEASARSACGLRPGDTVATANRALARAFRAAGLDTPELDARVMLQASLGLDHAGLVRAADRSLGAGEVEAIVEGAARRLRREPVAYITGEKEFWGLPLRVTAATLVPRPDTETVVEAALAAVDAAGGRARPLRIADLGTGSGAILLALLSELPNSFGVGVDVSADALAVARANAQRLGLDRRAAFCRGDFAAPLGGGFDLVVSNPPYIASEEIESLGSEVREHEPRLALDGGADGLAAYRRIARDAARLIVPGGRLIVEIGQRQGRAVAELFAEAGLELARPPVPDLAGIPRALILTGERGRQGSH